MQLITEYATPAELTGYAREALRFREENALNLNRWLPNETINDLMFRFSRGGGGLVEAARFRAFDAESDIAYRPGGSRVSGELPPISRKMPVSEYDQIKMRNVDTQNADIRDAMESDSVKLVAQLAARIELARGEALFTGAVTLNENGVQASVDFGRSAAHSVTASVAWDDTENAKAIDNLRAWVAVYNRTNGHRPAATLMSLTVYNLLMRNKQVRDLAFAGSAVAPGLITEASVNAVLASFGIPPVEIYDAQVNVDGVATRITPEDQLLFLPEQGDAAGKTLWGVPVEANDPRYGLAGDAAGIAVGGYKSEDPQTVWTRATTIALPVVAAPDLTLRATVLDDPSS
ncbi:major capsid protein [Streptomyces sp. NTK 937]|uniref:major capsid protein n=1 Tax=Streptomyces sp. NTK 937 TaxID=1487711 RepID=UPI0004A98273|nr:major capsid protein [Streptomyces sp. NTK 937]KDQ65688.1 phage capsid protein [Streptomyces sp. NTK 937]KDQ65766.1 phage capsid protein [Streptomyces sp. NTK 937]